MRSLSWKYREHKMKRDIFTICKRCKKKIKRVLSEFFTMNPFNKFTYIESIDICKDVIDKKEKDIRENGVLCRNCEELQQ